MRGDFRRPGLALEDGLAAVQRADKWFCVRESGEEPGGLAGRVGRGAAELGDEPGGDVGGGSVCEGGLAAGQETLGRGVVLLDEAAGVGGDGAVEKGVEAVAEELVAEGGAGVEGALALAGWALELAGDCQGEREDGVDGGGEVAPEADGEHGDAGPGVAVAEVEEGEGEERGEEGDEEAKAEDGEGGVDGEDVDGEDDEAVVQRDAGPAAGLNGLVVAPEGVFEDADDGVEDVVCDVGAEAEALEDEGDGAGGGEGDGVEARRREGDVPAGVGGELCGARDAGPGVAEQRGGCGLEGGALGAEGAPAAEGAVGGADADAPELDELGAGGEDGAAHEEGPGLAEGGGGKGPGWASSSGGGGPEAGLRD